MSTSIIDVVNKAAKKDPDIVEKNLVSGSRDTVIDNSRKENIKPIEYTTTRVINVDRSAMLENRVVSLEKENPDSIAFSMLRTKVLSEMRANDWTSLAISAPTPGAGKSLVAVNLAVSIALEANQTVLLVDMDLRQPSIHRYFGIEPKYGITDHLGSNVSLGEIMFNPGIERISVIPGRKRIVNSSETLASLKVKELVAELKSRYQKRLVIFDLPPYLVSDDALVFLPYVDCSLLVVESGKNNKYEIEESLSMAKVRPLIGTILNKDRAFKKINVY
ncbi:CpsD/CapB family tyrosine-protein kinase [Marinobacterium mangrovicola]|uniref:non-specific protein-tyrosine kinase n=1 Tax=Marinobacterium mangrovicola TaxID=1476959 RepID=A0A4R1GK20_9GAMM|nr:CpsD/CapB family tyrosine-protein kinase [Marinobacterium mangrovicola]TCK07533.1 capsular exopolysaccharide synthesis family protein [Marinobacterium mangrovicola]